MSYIPKVGESYEVHFWQAGANHIKTFEDFSLALTMFNSLMKNAGTYNLKLVKYVTRAEIIDTAYERSASLLTGVKS